METINNFTSDLLTIPLLVGIFFLIIGAILYCFPPQKINSLYGYRTPRAMQSEDSWKFAQTFSAIKIIQGGLLLLLSSGVTTIVMLNAGLQSILGYLLITVVVLAFFVITENTLKRKFPQSE